MNRFEKNEQKKQSEDIKHTFDDIKNNNFIRTDKYKNDMEYDESEGTWFFKNAEVFNHWVHYADIEGYIQEIRSRFLSFPHDGSLQDYRHELQRAYRRTELFENHIRDLLYPLENYDRVTHVDIDRLHAQATEAEAEEYLRKKA